MTDRIRELENQKLETSSHRSVGDMPCMVQKSRKSKNADISNAESDIAVKKAILKAEP